MVKTPIIEMLADVAAKSAARFSMPGHKGKAAFYGGELNDFDVTELVDVDKLALPKGAIKESEELCAAHMGAEKSFFLVNGASIGVMASVLSVLKPGDKVLVARDVHMSAINAFVLADVRPYLVYPSFGYGPLPGVLTPSDVKKAVKDIPDAKAFFMTYPNYYGLCADIDSIREIVHSAGMKLIVDAAHSAAFDYSEMMPLSPAEARSDIFTVSLHKTLPAMNQCALLCTGAGSGIDPGLVQAMINLLQTTSPSYLLLASIDSTLAYMRDAGKERLNSLVLMMEEYITRIEALGGYTCVTKDVPFYTGAFDRDILRLVIDVTDRGMSGFAASKKLYAKGVTVEAADDMHIILICSVADTKADFEALLIALNGVKGTNYSITNSMNSKEMVDTFSYKPVMEMREAVFGGRENIPLFEAAGRVSAVAVGAFPPGVPMLFPGQEITRDMINGIARLRQQGYDIFGSDGSIDVVV